jgi:hypothetical protein
MHWLTAIIDIGLVLGVLQPGDIELIESCFATRGARKGRILRSPKSRFDHPHEYAAWQAIISTVQPALMNAASVAWFLPDDARKTFERIDDWTRIRHVAFALRDYGQGYGEFTLDMDHNPMDPDRWARAIEDGIDGMLAKQAYA